MSSSPASNRPDPAEPNHRAQAAGGRLDIPVIDISGFETGSPAERQSIADRVDRAAREVGFMQIAGHGIPQPAIDGLAGAIDAFFALPAEQKQRTRAPSPHINRGYNGPKTERLSYSLGVASAADLFEAFNIGSQVEDFPGLALSQADYATNIWPPSPADFRPSIERWFDEAGRLARRLTRIFALALQLPDDYFVRLQDHSIDTLRLNHYAMPDGDLKLEPGQMGMGGHTDYGIVTVLWADRVSPGLQVLDSNGRWHDVMPAPGALLINLGDMLARWTNDRWMSTMHRVLPPIGPDGRVVRRRSAAYFHDGNADAVIQCLPSCTDADHPPLYQPITVGEHLAAKLAGSRALQVNEGAEREGARLKRAEQAG